MRNALIKFAEDPRFGGTRRGRDPRWFAAGLAAEASDEMLTGLLELITQDNRGKLGQ